MMEVSALRKSFGSWQVLRGVDLKVRGRELVVVVGPNGAGKTTLLNSIAGLIRPDEGRIIINGEAVFVAENGKVILEEAPEKRRVSLVPRDYALFPHLTVKKNLELALRARNKLSKSEMEERIRRLAEQFELEKLLEKKPGELSGGERQRVALARAMASESRVLLLDEPLESIDPMARPRIRGWLKKALKSIGITALLVTHDLNDAWALGDRIIIMNNGKVIGEVSPEKMIENAATPKILEFLGYNVIRASVKEIRENYARIRVGGKTILLENTIDLKPENEVLLAFGPGDILLEKPSQQNYVKLSAKLIGKIPSKSGFILEFEMEDGQRVRAEISRAAYHVLRDINPRLTKLYILKEFITLYNLKHEEV